LPNVIQKSNKGTWAVFVERMGEMRNEYIILLGKTVEVSEPR
jgi:hypothetical protein